MKNQTAFLFSGQGSQYHGMAKELCERFPAAAQVLELAGDVLGYRLEDVMFPDSTNFDEDKLARTAFTQPAIFACSLCALAAARESGLDCGAVAGHSLGEYAALVAAGVLTAEEGFRVIKARAQAMEKAAQTAGGAMYAIIGLPADEVEAVCAETDGYVTAVNYNSPVQTVIAGETEAAARAAAAFTARKAKAMKLNVAAAFHSTLMQPAADEFLAEIKGIAFRAPQAAFYSNVTGARLTDFADFPALMARHIVSPVRFTAELEALSAAGYTDFIELGPNKVLTGLVKKTLKTARALNIEDSASLDKSLAALAAE
ncbi:MAG: ACP S-malonyltransferase [Oscillospiraceae bacterium]